MDENNLGIGILGIVIVASLLFFGSGSSGKTRTPDHYHCDGQQCYPCYDPNCPLDRTPCETHT